MILVAVVAVFFTGPVAEHLGERIGLGDTTTLVWSWLRWPILFLVVALLFAVFYQVTPDARRKGSRAVHDRERRGDRRLAGAPRPASRPT